LKNQHLGGAVTQSARDTLRGRQQKDLSHSRSSAAFR
jgi:hypothetical protein